MAFNFPSGAVPGQQYTTDNGITYVFDGQIWNVVATPASNTLVGNVTIDGGLELTGSISGGYSRIHFVSESSGEVGSNLSTIQMVPDINSPSSEQILIIDPTGGYPNHIHLRPGGPMDNSSISIILGGENSNVSVVGGTNPPVQITSNNYLWQFNTDGTLIFPDSTNQTTAFTGLPNGSVSGSSQLTESLDLRYTLSGSVQPLPSNLVSSSAQITAFGFISSSETINTGSFLTTSSYQTDSASFDTRINSITLSSGSNLTYLLEAYANVTYTLPGGFTEDPCRYSVVSVNENVPSNWFNTSTYRFTPQKAGYWEINAAYDVYRNTEASMAIRKNGNIVASAGSFNAVAQDISKIIYLNGSTDYIDIVNTGGAALQRNQYQQRSWFQAKFVGNIDGATDLPAGVISGSSQLTSSFDTRYLNTGGDNIISGSSQLTSSFDTRYTLSSSYNTDSSSFNSRFNGLITTGSNTFSGSQVFSGSMTVTSGQVIASSITANSSSLYLTSGSNMYVQNNGIVEVTGSLKVKGTARFETVGGDEGGEIEFGVPQTNTSLTSSVKVDVYQNTLRIFDGNTKGVYIDLSKAPTGANGELMWKASGFVNAGDYVTLGNLKARIPTSGNRSLQVATVSGTYSVYGSNIYSQIGGIAGSTLSSPLSITTTPTYLNAANGFTVAGAMDTWVIIDTVNFIAWRITMIIGPLFNANLITIERLY